MKTSAVFKWFDMNKLILSVSKCYFMIYCNKIKSLTEDESKIFINGKEIPQVNFQELQLMKIQDGKKHIHHVCRRSIKMLGTLRKVYSLIHHSAHLTLYYSFTFPHPNYSNIVQAAIYPSYLSKLFIIQKGFLRMVSQSGFQEPSAPLFKKILCFIS